MKPSPVSRLFSELVDGAPKGSSPFILNSGDVGLLGSLDRLSADEASANANGGATIAAHAQHVRYGLSLMNRWGREGGDPFADAKWDEAWKVTTVDDAGWREIRDGLRLEIDRWREIISAPRTSDFDQAALIASVAHLAYHVGAIRQISRTARGPREGTFSQVPR